MATSSIFSGSSRFSSVFSQVIDRSVRIATLPKTLLEQQKASVDKRTAGLVSLNTKVAALQSSLRGIAEGLGSGAWSANSSNRTAVTVTTTGDKPTAGSWNMSVSDLGATTAFTVTGFPAVSDPSQGTYITGASQTLLIDVDPNDALLPETISLSPTGATLQNVVDEINRKAGSKVQATMVNVGTSAAPNYQLSVQSLALGPVDITFQDDALESKNAPALRGWAAKYTVNGLEIQTDSRSVTLAPGVNLELKATTTTPVTIDTRQMTDALASGLGNSVTAYNAVLTEIGKNRGDKTAALSGDSILNTVNSSLRQLLTATAGSAGFKALTDLGIGFDKTNRLSLNQAAFNKATAGNFSEIRSFFGNIEEGGLLKTLNGALDTLTKPTSGVLVSAIDTLERASKAQEAHIAQAQERIDKLEERLIAQMAAADASIALLEQQVNYFSGMWKAMSQNKG